MLPDQAAKPFWRRPSFFFLMVSATLIAGLGAAFLFSRFFESPEKASSRKRDAAVAEAKEVIVQYLNKTMHDPASLEIVSWDQGKLSEDGIVTVLLAARGKNAFGAKVLSTQEFRVKGGKVVSVSRD